MLKKVLLFVFGILLLETTLSVLADEEVKKGMMARQEARYKGLLGEQSMLSNSSSIHVSGIIVDDSGNPLNDVELELNFSRPKGWDSEDLTRKFISNSQFFIEQAKYTGLTVYFRKKGYFEEKKIYSTEMSSKYLKNGVFSKTDEKVVLREIGKLAKLKIIEKLLKYDWKNKKKTFYNMETMSPETISADDIIKAKIPGRCFDNSLTGTWTGYTTPDIYGYYFSGESPASPYLANVQSKVTKFIRIYNENDWALGWWWNGNKYKPDNVYLTFNYEGPNDKYDTAATPIPSRFYDSSSTPERTLNLPADRFEIFSYCAESRTVALGAQAGSVSGFTVQVNLQDPAYGYDGKHYSHSRQFRSDIIAEHAYWNMVITYSGLPIIP